MAGSFPDRLTRRPLSEHTIERIRRERHSPEPTQWDYLHLKGLRDVLTSAFERTPEPFGPVLDLYCGTKPYVDVIPWAPVIGLDIDLHFGRADVVASGALPFRAGAFGAVLCTQALYLVDDPAFTVAETRRVLRPGGFAIFTVPYIFRRELPYERRYNGDDLRRLFADWQRVEVIGFGGPGAGAALYVGSLLAAAARRWRPVRFVLPLGARLLNLLFSGLDRLGHAVALRWPASYSVIAHHGEVR